MQCFIAVDRLKNSTNPCFCSLCFPIRHKKFDCSNCRSIYSSLDGLDLNVLQSMAEGADLVREVDRLLVIFTFQFSLGHPQLHRELESLRLLRSDADQAGDRGLGAQFQLEFLGCYRERAPEAGRVTAPKKLLGVSAYTT